MKNDDENKVNEDLEVVFVPGCFDNFEGTQEELDAMIKGITESIQSMSPEELEENIIELDDEDLAEVFANNKQAAKIISELAMLEQRKLH